MIPTTKLPIGYPPLISGVLINQKHDIVYTKYEIGVPPSQLNSTYKLFVRKQVSYIVLPSFTNCKESYLIGGENVHDISPRCGSERSHLLKIIMHESKAL